MRKIEAIIRPEKFNDVRDGLAKYGVKGFTASEVLGTGLQKGQIGIYRGRVFDITLLPKIKIEVVVPADVVDDVIDALINPAKTGEIGDGKIFVTPVQQAVRIRNGDTGKSAL